MNPVADYMPELLGQLQQPGLAPDAALRLLTEAAQAYPTDPRPMVLLAAECMQQGDADRAEAIYGAVLQHAPGFAIARFQLGLLQFTSGRPVTALATWGPLDDLAEEDCLRLFKRAFEHLARDEFTETRALLQRGIVANTSNPQLNRDMQMLAERLASQVTMRDAEPAGEHAAAEEAHFLLSAYRNRH